VRPLAAFSVRPTLLLHALEGGVSRPSRFESFRYLGDKRTQIVYDLDLVDDAGLQPVIDEVMASEAFAAFAPDTLAEARNRGYKPHRSIRLQQEEGV
jgi:hypothetical protein